MMKSVVTRFRAFQLGSAGSSFSYFAGGHFTVMEGRLTDVSRPSLIREMQMSGVTVADDLHITGWDQDHCASSELEELLDLIAPRHIEIPGYDPHSDNADECLDIIEKFRAARARTNRPATVRAITPAYLNELDAASRLGFRNILYHPKFIDAKSNNNSTIKFFRGGSFNVLSLGDVESNDISARLRRCRFLGLETDIMILAHHGANNGFTTKRLLQHLEPQVAVCSSNYDNHHDHPDEKIRELLQTEGIDLMTTKTGDVVIKSIDNHTGLFQAINIVGGTANTFSRRVFRARKAKLLAHNDDTIRQIYAKKSRSWP
jgi:competence protein ComEC